MHVAISIVLFFKNIFIIPNKIILNNPINKYTLNFDKSILVVFPIYENMPNIIDVAKNIHIIDDSSYVMNMLENVIPVKAEYA